MNSTAQWVRDHRMVAFFGLTYAISWSLVPFGSFLPTGALIAALIVISLADGREGLRQLGLRIVKWRFSPWLYLAAIAIPVAVLTFTIVTSSALASTSPSFDQFDAWYSIIVVFAARMIDPLNGPVAEEPSFRGFAQPTLEVGRSRFAATAILAVLVTIWHVPLYFIDEFELQPIESLATVGCTFFYAWLFARSGGSVLITLIAHVTEGWVRIGPLWGDGPDTGRAVTVYTVAWFTVGVLVVVCDRSVWRVRTERP